MILIQKYVYYISNLEYIYQLTKHDITRKFRYLQHYFLESLLNISDVNLDLIHINLFVLNK